MSTTKRRIQKTPKFYKKAVKQLRHYADGFGAADGYDLRKFSSWTPAQKAKVTKLWNLVHLMRSGSPKYVYRPRRKDHLRAAQETSQQPHYPKNLKVAFLPIADPKIKPKIRFKKQKKIKHDGRVIGKRSTVVIEQRGVKKIYINYDPLFIAMHPLEAIRDAMKAVPNASRWRFIAGVHEVYDPEFTIDPGATPEQIALKLEYLMTKYDADSHDPDDPSSHYFGNWLHGLVAYIYDREGSMEIYENKREIASMKIKEWRKKQIEEYEKEKKKAQIHRMVIKLREKTGKYTRAHGYDLREFDNWKPAKIAAVRRAYNRLKKRGYK